MGVDPADLDRFGDSDSEPASGSPAGAPAAASRRARDSRGASSTTAAAASPLGASKAARLRAKKAAARVAQRARRRDERARFPPRSAAPASPPDDPGASDPDASDDDAAARDRRVHHGTLVVEGVVVDGKLVLLDRKSGAVYSSTRRAWDGSHLRVGAWVESPGSPGGRVERLPRDAIDAQRKPPPKKTKKKKAEEEPSDDDPSDDPSDVRSPSAYKMAPPPASVTHAFDVSSADDHCETSPEAHAHLRRFLDDVAGRLRKAPRDLVIYDPYYCAGGTKRSFAALGYERVINENEDFYAVVREGRVPAHDVLVTNPPYSADHVERCLTFAAENLERRGRPYFLLLPSYVVHKPYYVQALLTGGASGRAKRAEDDERAVNEPGDVEGEKEGGALGNEEEEKEEEESDGSESDEPAREPDSKKETSSSSSSLDSDSDSEPAMKVRSGAAAAGRRVPGSASAGPGSSRKQTLPFYVVPDKRYYYWTPKALVAKRRDAQASSAQAAESASARKKKHHVGRLGERTSPFQSFWYVGLGEHQAETLRRHRKLPRASVEGYRVATHPNDLPTRVLDEWDPSRREREDAEEGTKNGKKKKAVRRYAGFSGANCGQNMPAEQKRKYANFRGGDGGGRTANWSAGKRRKDAQDAMFSRPRRKNAY